MNIEDLGETQMTCEMCESQAIRFVHYMENDRYNGPLACGAVCAGHMESDLARAEARDKKMRSSSSRRRRFPNRAGWKINAKGNHVLRANGYRITVFRKRIFWGAVVSRPPVDTPYFTREKFSTVEAAKMAAFDTMSFMEEHVPKLNPFRSLIQPF
ncbi:hypothetical protein [Mesorhizobium amorphae]|uniref:hypothetical protein n=1 Tax=Mesorhizobium amorphae TaxID=71433 RepID=UPI0017834B88|nr:hypothetical protein [Mesorhizobium amorphae]